LQKGEIGQELERAKGKGMLQQAVEEVESLNLEIGSKLEGKLCP